MSATEDTTYTMKGHCRVQEPVHIAWFANELEMFGVGVRDLTKNKVDLQALQPNGILEALSPEHRTTLLKRMELVPLAQGQPLLNARDPPRYTHFLVAGVASLTMTLRNADGLDVAMVGHEGLVEAVHLLGSSDSFLEAVMQTSGAAYRLPLSDLKCEFLACEALRCAILRDVQRQMQLTSYLALCNYFHSVEARLARWLLMMADRTGRSDLDVTHSLLAQMLGVRRPTLTLAAESLQHEGSIRYRRGAISIVDRPLLRRRSCECYDNIAQLR